MFSKVRRQNGLMSLFIVTAFLLSSLPVPAQDIVTSSDISSGSSVFVFRSSRKPKQKNTAFNTTSRQKRSAAQKTQSRNKIVRQSNTVAKSIQSKRPTKRIDAQEYKRLEPKIPTMTRQEASLVFAGAGEYYLERDDVEKGVEFFRESVKLDKDNKFARLGFSDALMRLGNQLLEKENFPQAKFYFEEAIVNDDKNATAYAGLAEVFGSTGEDDKATLNYEKALSLSPDLTALYTPLGISYFQKGEIAKARTFLSKALATNPDDAETLYFMGLIHYKDQRWSDAENAMLRALKTDPNNAEAHYYLGEIYSKQNRNDDAIGEYQKAVQANPKYGEAWFDLGAAYYNDENYAEAIKAYEKVIILDNRRWEAYLNLADTYWQAGNYAKSEGNYTLALAFLKRNNEVSNEEKAEIYSKFGFTLGQQCRVKMEKAERCDKWIAMIDKFQQAVDLVPDAINYSNLGWAYFNQGHLDVVSRRDAAGREKLLKAKTALENAVRLKPPFIEAPLMNLGGTLIDLGEYPAAIETLKKVAGKRGDWATADYMLGVAYRKNADLDNASKSFKKALDKENNYVAALAGLGETEFRRNKKGETEKIISRLRKIGTNDALLEAQKLQAVMNKPF